MPSTTRAPATRRSGGTSRKAATSSRKAAASPRKATASPRKRDPHCGPVPQSAWLVDAEARKGGRVAMFNATRPGGLDGWTMDLRQYEAMRTLILGEIDAAEDGEILVKELVDIAQRRYGKHALFPKGRLRNYCTYTKVDLEARCEIERVVGKSPQRVRRWRDA